MPSSDPTESDSLAEPISAPISDHDRAYLTVEQAAAYLQLSESSVRAYIRQGELKAFRVAGIRSVRIAKAELVKLLQPARPE